MIKRFIKKACHPSSLLKAGAVYLALAATSLQVQAQVHEFQKHIGSSEYKDIGRKVNGAPGYGYIITGEGHIDHPTFNSDLFLTRTNIDGTTVWSYTYGANLQGDVATRDWGNSVIPTSDNGFVAVGGAMSGGTRKAYIVKVDQNGILQWHHMAATANAEYYDVIEDDGMYVVVGWEQGDIGSRNVFIAKYAPNGALLNHVVIDINSGNSTTYDDEGRSIVKTANGYAVTGITKAYSQGTRREMLLLEIDKNLSIISRLQSFVDQQGSASYRFDTWGNNIISTLDGGLLIVGGIERPPAGTTAMQREGYVIKFNAQRQYTWVRRIDTWLWSEVMQAKELLAFNPMTGQVTGSSGFIFGGYSDGRYEYNSTSWWLRTSLAFLMRVNSNGTLVASHSYRPTPPPGVRETSIRQFHSILLVDRGLYSIDDKGVVAVGESETISTNSPQDAYFIKTYDFQLTTPCHTYDGPTVSNLELAFHDLIPIKSKPIIFLEDNSTKRSFENVETLCYKYYPPFKPTKQGDASFLTENTLFAQIMPNLIKSGDPIELMLNNPYHDKQQMEITVTDVMGRVVLDGAHIVGVGQSTLALHVPKLAVGMYMVNVSYGNQTTHLKLVITE